MSGPINPDTITFDAPTKFKEDQSSIPVGTISKYQYGFSLASQASVAQASKRYTIIVDDTNMTPDANGKQDAPLTIAGALAFGQWFGASRAVSKDGTVSDWSNEAAFVLQAKTPEAPANFAVG
jgi:hypothetical protein